MQPKKKELERLELKTEELEDRQPKSPYTWSPYFDNWDKITLDSIKFIFQQSEKRFLDTVDNHKAITSRAYTFLSIFITVISVLITFFGSRILSGYASEELPILIVAGLAVVPSIWILNLLLKLIYPREMMNPGNEPKNILQEEKLEYEGEQQSIVWFYGAIEQLQHQIDYNEHLAEIRFSKLEMVMKIASISLLIIFATIIVMSAINLS